MTTEGGQRKKEKKSKVFNLSYAEKQKTFLLSSKRQDIKRRKTGNPRRKCISSCI